MNLQMADPSKLRQQMLAHIKGGGILPLMNTPDEAEQRHHNEVEAAFKELGFLHKVGMLSLEEIDRVRLMLIAPDRESQILGISVVSKNILDVSHLVEAYKASLAHKPEGEK